MRSWPSDASPALSTGIMNHINKDSRPDLLERINVEVEPGGGRTALNQNEENTGKKGRELAEILTQVDEVIII